MANAADIQQELLRLVRPQTNTTPLSGLAPIASQSVAESTGNDAVTNLTQELDSLRRQLGTAEETTRRQADILEQNTRAVIESGARASSSVSNTARDVVSSVRGAGGLGILGSPFAGLASWLLNRRGQSGPETELPVSSLPSPIDANLGFASSNGAGLDPVSYRADGLSRTASSPRPAPAANITVQVQTMDSRSFMDNSDQIARAVREAMLNSHSINDVIGEM